MKLRLARFLVAGVVLGLTGHGVASPQTDRSERHVKRAFALAGESYLKTTAQLQCGAENAAMAFVRDPSIIPATRIFDNVIYLGFTGVGAYAILTDEGIILIDALNSTDDVRRVIEPGLREHGLDPASIKTVIITQGHGDHYGGAKYLAETYGARLMMSAADWDLLDAMAGKGPFANNPRFGEPPKRDLILTDGQDVILGNTRVRIVLTPGHSPATASLIFPVFAQGKRHMAGMWGGTGIPREQASIRDYANSAKRFLRISKRHNVDVELNTHAFVNDSLRRMTEIRTSGNDKNPFVIGTSQYAKYTKILEECARSKLD